MKNVTVHLYCIKDDVNGFMTPFADVYDTSAVRGFELFIQREGTPQYNHPEQFNLFKLGDFDTESGEIVPSVECIQYGNVFRKVSGNE